MQTYEIGANGGDAQAGGVDSAAAGIELLKAENLQLQAQLEEERRIGQGREAILARVARALRSAGIPSVNLEDGDSVIPQAVRVLVENTRYYRERLEQALTEMRELREKLDSASTSVVVHRNERAEEITIELERNSRGYTWRTKYVGPSLAETLARIDEANAALRARYGEPADASRG